MKNTVIEALLNSPHADGDKLPSVRQLMQYLHTASGTVQSALRELANRGFIYTDPGKGCFWGKRKAVELPPLKPSAQNELSEKFFADVRSGYFSLQGALPSQKELALRYRVSITRMRQFLKDIQQKGMLEREGKSRYFFPKQDERSETEILFITRSTEWGAYSPVSEREMDFLKFVYRTGAEKNLNLRLLGFNEETEQFFDRNGNTKQISEYPNVVGAIVSTLLMQKPFRILSQLQNANFPISIWWEHAALDLPKSFLKKEGWAFFNSTFGKNPGKTVGKYLLQKGIQKIEYISPYHASTWCRDRLKGLEESGLEVIPHVDGKYASPWDFRELEKDNGPKHTIDLRAKNHEKEILRSLASEASPEIPWVTVNDETAGLLLELKEEKVLAKTPYMVGFDNSVESYLLRLDSFDFNTEVLAAQMFYHLELGKNDPFKSPHLREISGKIVEK